jgi:hypothetical protein
LIDSKISSLENFEQAKSLAENTTTDEEIVAVLDKRYKSLSREEKDAWKHRAETLNSAQALGASVQALVDGDATAAAGNDGGGKRRARKNAVAI